MASIPPKKPSTPANPRRPSANPTPTGSGTPSRSPSRAAATTTTATGMATNGVSRTRSVRAGAPPSARAAARKPAADNAADADAKAELNAKLEELQEQLRQTEEASQDQQKHNTVLQARLDEALKEQGLLDERVHEQIERVEELENEKKESLRARRELEQIYENEQASILREREEASTREEELQASVQRMKETLAHREMRAGFEDELKPSISRNPSFRRSGDVRSGEHSPSLEAQFAPSSVQRSDSRSSSKLVMQKDRIIEGLRLELAEAQIKLVEMEHRGGGGMQELQREMYDVKMQNARLMEENDSFQLLLSEKTLNGEFSQSEFLRPPSPGAGTSSRPSSRHANAQGASLADELGSQADETEVSILGDDTRKAQAEANSLRDQNKALTLYINNIISRLLQHEQFEQILDKTPDIMAGPYAASRRGPPVDTDKELPPPPPPKDEPNAEVVGSQDGEQQQPMGFLQRAKSVVTRPKPRPLSQAQGEQVAQSLQAPSRHENPDTAPKIPLGRSPSTRGNSAHRRAKSEWAAGVVGNMYRGPSSASGGPLSPGLGSPRERSSFFATAQPLSAAGSRVPSGTSVPTIHESETGKENAMPQPAGQQRDSKISSGRDSAQFNSQGGGTPLDSETSTDAGAEASAPTSPPRSVTSSGDRESRAGGGAIMMGSKMRPLRLVQEAAAEEDKDRRQANRASWFGWMNKGVSGKATSNEGGAG